MIEKRGYTIADLPQTEATAEMIIQHLLDFPHIRLHEQLLLRELQVQRQALLRTGPLEAGRR